MITPRMWLLIITITLTFIFMIMYYYIGSNIRPMDYGNATFFEYWFGI